MESVAADSDDILFGLNWLTFFFPEIAIFTVEYVVYRTYFRKGILSNLY